MTPYLSIVIVGRNDDYGGDFLSRINSFVRSLDHQLLGHDGLVELIIVEWNPLSDRLPLRDVLPTAINMDLRIITVSKEIHDSIGHPWPVLEMYGKNVGIRRSRGEYVLTTNPDIIFSDEMIGALVEKPLNVEYFYRCDRFDFNGQGMDKISVHDYTDFAIAHTFQGHLSDNLAHAINPGTPLKQFPSSDPKNIHTNGAGDFILASKVTFFSVNGLFESKEYFYHMDAISVLKIAYNGIKQATIPNPMCIFHQDHPRGKVDPWNPQLAIDLARDLGSIDWGLRGLQIPEWKNR